MTTHIERAVSEVRVESEPRADGAEGDPRWQEQERLQRSLERGEMIQLRTRAEGFDD